MMFLSQMLANVRNYLTVTLFALAIFFGYVSYSSYGKIAKLEAEVIALESRIKIAHDDLERQETSCKVSQAVISTVAEQNDTLQKSAQAHLEALQKLVYPTLQENTDDVSKAATEALNEYADRGRLSPDLMRVLNAAYCSGKKDDPTCTP